MKRNVTILLILFWQYSFSQNLVPNGSFEQYYSCPNNTAQVDTCIGWHKVMNTPDYFNVCSPYPVCIPDNFEGYQLPYEGQAYMGLYTYLYWSFYREIIGTQLTDTMNPGNVYNISMRVNRGNWTNMSYNCSASNKLGMRFTTHAYSSLNSSSINNYAQVYTDSIIEDTLNWVLLSWTYIPDSAYTHVYVGNFFDDAHTDTTIIAAPDGQFGQAYYFIDSVNIVCTSSNCFTGVYENNSLEEIKVFPVPANGKIFIRTKSKVTNFSLFNTLGIIVKEGKFTEEIEVSNLANGIYVIAFDEKYFYKIVINHEKSN